MSIDTRICIQSQVVGEVYFSIPWESGRGPLWIRGGMCILIEIAMQILAPHLSKYLVGSKQSIS